jgi:hypothetical protein
MHLPASLQTYGGCLSLAFSNATVRDSVFDSNTCDFIGGAVHLDRASAMYAYNTTFNNNTVSVSGRWARCRWP